MIKKHDVQGLRNVLYAAVSTIGNIAEDSETNDFDELYKKGDELLDIIDQYCKDKNIPFEKQKQKRG